MIDIEFPGHGASLSLHNHSVWSDGEDTLEDMCLAAKAAGIRVFGMSDHWVLPPISDIDSWVWSMQLDRLPEYCREMQRIRDKYQDEDFQILIGLEVDYFHENHIYMREHLAQFGFDYLIGSVHYSGHFPIDHDAKDWIEIPQSQKDSIWDVYWNKLEGAAKEEAFQIIGHFDLPKKYGHMPSKDYFDKAVSVLETVRDHGKAIELNTAGWFKDCKEQYPKLSILKVAHEMGIPVVISTDSHAVSHIARGAAEAEAVLREAGYDIK